MKKLYFITGNEGKFKEAKAVLDGAVELEQLDIDLSEIQSLDSHEVIQEKLKEASKMQKGSFIIEDVSVEIKCLNGFPGPLIKWFWKSLGNEGIAELVERYENREVEAKAIVGYLSEEVKYFEASIQGKIVKPRGENGWGWDPIFEVDGTSKTLAELTDDEKNEVSMRKKAFEKLREYLLEE